MKKKYFVGILRYFIIMIVLIKGRIKDDYGIGKWFFEYL